MVRWSSRSAPEAHRRTASDRRSQFREPSGSVKVLHVVESLDGQATESWLMRMFAVAAQRELPFHWSFFCVLGRPGRQDGLARALGAEVIHSDFELANKRRFFQNLRRVMKRGRYDILHCHHDIISAVYLLASVGLPFRRRIVHIHNTSMSLPTPSVFKRRMACEPMRRVCLNLADRLVGVSRAALDSMLVGKPPRPGRDTVVYCGVDTAKFRGPAPDPAGLRRALGFDPDALVMLFVGRMVEYKNPRFVVEMLTYLVGESPAIVAVFAGSGPEETVVRELAGMRSLGGRVRLLGWRDDVAKLMRSCDLLVWPSLETPKEGLGLGVVEAQAAGLPILISSSVSEDAVVVPQLVEMRPLSNGPKVWAETARELLYRKYPPREESLARVEASPFSNAHGLVNLVALYRDLES